MKRLEKLWRLLGTGLSFTVFGLGGLLTGFVIFPLVFVFVRNQDKRRHFARHFIGRAFSGFIWLMKSLGVLSYRVEGVENARHGHNQLIIANHPTLIDVVFLISLFPMADCAVKEAVINNPFMRGVIVPAQYFASDDPGEFLDTCVARLVSGCSLLLFPEGTRSVHGQALQFKPAAASIAFRSGAGILPVIIQCTQPRFLAKHEPWYKVPDERPFFLIRVQPVVPLEELIPDDLDQRKATRALNQRFLGFYDNDSS